MKISLTALLFVSLLLGSCEKEILPLPASNDPVFSAQGTFNAMPIELTAGEDEVFMQTSIEKVNGINFYKGVLGNQDIEVELGIFSGNVDLENTSFGEDLSGLTSIKYANQPQQPILTLSKDLMVNHDLIEQVIWYVDGAYAGINDLTISTPGSYEICAQVIFTDGTQANLCNEGIVGYRSNADFELAFFVGQDNMLKAWIDSDAENVQSVKWYIDGVLISESLSLSREITANAQTVRAEVEFTNGVKKSRSVLADGTGSGKFIHDFTRFAILYPIEWDYRAKLKVTYNGQEYFSHLTTNFSNCLEVQSVDYYGVNSQGIPVYTLKGVLTANLRSATSADILPLELNVSIGIPVNK